MLCWARVSRAHLRSDRFQWSTSVFTFSYVVDASRRAQAFAGGWFHTGDQGFLDEDGFLTLTGRIKELINRGGEKISPLEVRFGTSSGPLC